MNHFVQILFGLNFLHRNKISHRDIKPDNVLLFENAKIAKLADLGLAREVNFEGSKHSIGLGTNVYQAPEV